MKPEFELYDRREFFGVAGRSAAILGLGGSLAANANANGAEEANPFAYDISRHEKTDPAMVAYVEVARWRSPRPEPKRMAVGPDDRIYLCAGSYLTVLSLGGATLHEVALDGVVYGAAAAKDGTVYAATRDHVEVFDAAGNRKARWDSAGRKSWLTSLAAGEDDLFAADSGNRVVLRYDRSGKLKGTVGKAREGRPAPGFVLPSPYLDVEIHRDGLLRVNNPGRHRVEAYTFDGDFEGAWGKPSLAMEGFCGCCNPVAIAVLPDGRIVTGEKGLPRVKVYTAAGEFESVVAGPEAFPENAKASSDPHHGARGGMDVAADSRGWIHTMDFVTGEARVLRRKS